MSSTDDDFDVEIGADDADDPKDDDKDSDDDKTPEQLKEELAKTRAALARANKQAERARTKQRPAPKRPAQKASEDDDGDRGPTQAEERFKRVAVRTAGAAALLASGYSGTRSDARDLTRLLDLDDLDVDEDGEVDGLDEAVEELKTRFPALFQQKTKADENGRRPRPRSVDAARGAGRRRDADAPTSSAVRLGQMLRGGK